MNSRPTTGRRLCRYQPARGLLIILLVGRFAFARQPVDAPPVQQEPNNPPPATSFVIVEGQITDEIGAGQEGAAVTLRRKTEGTSESEVIATTTTNRLGDFAITMAERITGDVIVTISAPFFATLTRELHLGDDDRPPFIAENLEGKIIVIGRVLDAVSSLPLANASALLTSRYREWRASTDEQGRFTIRGVPPGRGELVVEAANHGRDRQGITKLEDFGEIVIRLKPERVVHIKAVDDLKAPIGGVSLECLDQPRDDFRTSVTDQAGVATLRGIHFDARSLRCRLTHPEHVSDEELDREIVAPDDAAESSHELVMLRAGSIEGRVTDARSGEPLNGARVITGDSLSDRTPRGWANYLGQYAIHGVKPGPTVVTAHCSGHAPDLKTVDVKAGESSSLDIRLGPGAAVKGNVKRETGEPISGATVEAATWRGHTTLGLRAMSGGDGRFVIKDVPPDEFEVTVYAPAFGTATKTVKAGDADVEITLFARPETGEPSSIGWLNVGDTAPVLKLTTLDGQVLNLANLRGKTVLLHFWMVNCPLCLEDLPHLLSVRETFRMRSDFGIIGVSLDAKEQAARDFITQWKTDWPQVFGDAGGSKSAAGRYGVQTPPATFLIDPQGKLLGVYLRGSDIRTKVEQALKDYDPT